MARKSRIWKRYAKSFFNSVELSEAEAAIGQVRAVNELLGRSREIAVALTSPLFSKADRKKTVSVIAEAMKLSTGVRAYLDFLADEGMIDFLDDILRGIVASYNERRRKAMAEVFTPVDFSGNLRARLEAALRKLSGMDEVAVKFVVDPSLLGGFIVKIGSTMYDSSLKGQLRLLKDELIKG